MAYKFKVGQAVRFIDCADNKWSPPCGTVGTVLKVSPIGIEYLVKFPDGTVRGLEHLPKGYNFWYYEDELEAVVDGREEEYEYAYSPMSNSKRAFGYW